MQLRIPLVVLALALGLAAQGCGGLAPSKASDASPQGAAESYLRALVGGDCPGAARYLAKPTPLWKASCRDAYRFSLACEEVPGSGNPQSEECGPDTKITVGSVEAGKPQFEGRSARIDVVVAYTLGRHTRRTRTVSVELRRHDGTWKVSNSS